MNKIFSFTLTAYFVVLSGGIQAMEFEIIDFYGREVLLASGPIERGDEIDYLIALKKTPIQPHGARVVLLDSPGGSVDAALAMSAVNDDYMVHMRIPDGASCASACASILYISGDYRTTAATGRFGQHSCSFGGVANAECNEEISMHAVGHGVSHGAVSAFVTYTPPEDVMWFDSTSLDCWYMSYYPFTEQSGFDRVEPCFMEHINGYQPDGQLAWRVDLKLDGYRAFARPVSDSTRDFEVGIYCDENIPGQMLIDFDLTGPTNEIFKVLTTGRIILSEKREIELPYALSEVDNGFTRVTFTAPVSLTREILTKADRIGVKFDVIEGYQPISSWVDVTSSREALLFVANNCVNRLAKDG
jgi:hypothetical protein